MVPRPLGRRVLDGLGLLLCALIALLFTVNAVWADSPTERVLLGFVAFTFAGMFVRTAPLMARDWRSDGEPEQVDLGYSTGRI